MLSNTAHMGHMIIIEYYDKCVCFCLQDNLYTFCTYYGHIPPGLYCCKYLANLLFVFKELNCVIH